MPNKYAIVEVMQIIVCQNSKYSMKSEMQNQHQATI